MQEQRPHRVCGVRDQFQQLLRIPVHCSAPRRGAHSQIRSHASQRNASQALCPPSRPAPTSHPGASHVRILPDVLHLGTGRRSMAHRPCPISVVCGDDVDLGRRRPPRSQCHNGLPRRLGRAWGTLGNSRCLRGRRRPVRCRQAAGVGRFCKVDPRRGFCFTC